MSERGKCEWCKEKDLPKGNTRFCSRGCCAQSQKYLFEIGDIKHFPYLEVTPLIPYIQAAVKRAGGVSTLGRRLADRFGTKPESEERQLHRILGGQVRFIKDFNYDKLETFLT